MWKRDGHEKTGGPGWPPVLWDAWPLGALSGDDEGSGFAGAAFAAGGVAGGDGDGAVWQSICMWRRG